MLAGSKVDISAAVPEIASLLEDPDVEIRWRSLLMLEPVLERTGTLPASAVAALRKMATDEANDELRTEAARAIEDLGGK